MTFDEAIRGLVDHLDDVGVWNYGGLYGKTAALIHLDGVERASDGQWQTRIRIDYDYDYEPTTSTGHDDAHKTIAAIESASDLQLKIVIGPNGKRYQMSFYAMYTGEPV